VVPIEFWRLSFIMSLWSRWKNRNRYVLYVGPHEELPMIETWLLEQCFNQVTKIVSIHPFINEFAAEIKFNNREHESLFILTYGGILKCQ